MHRSVQILLFLLLSIGVSLTAVTAAEVDDPPKAVTTSDPKVPTEELALLLNPLSKDELLIEAEGWREIVKAKAEEIAQAEIAVRRQTQAIEKAKDIKEKTAEARDQLAKVAKKADEAKLTGDAEKIAEAQEAAAEARDSLNEVAETVDEAVGTAKKAEPSERELSEATRQQLDETLTAAEKATQAAAHVEEAIEGSEGRSEDEALKMAEGAREATAQATEATQAVEDKVDETLVSAMADTEKAAALDAAGEALEQAEDARKEEKIGLLETVTRLREERTLLLDNMRAVIDELQAKTDKDDADTLGKIRDYQLYINSVSGITIDVTDTTSAWVSLKGWITSEQGGLRWLINIGTFLGILVAAWFAARLLSGIARRAMARLSSPALLSDFLVRSVRWVVMIIGIIWALSALEISVAPLLALVGAAGFIIAFAMQDSLSNFASGLMILFFRPFDMGDVVDAGGVSGKVSSVNLVSTTIRTFDNKLMVVPNSKIWSDVITNATGVTERRVDMEFGIGYDDDIDRAQQVLEEIVAAHPKVLKEPAPTIRMNTLADSSVNFICRPWATPADYWDVYWDITKEVKKRFDAAGIGIPFPQRDVHLYLEGNDNSGKALDSLRQSS